MRVERKIADGMVTIDGMPWTRCVARKAGECRASGHPFPAGTYVYRPVTNNARRGERVMARWVEEQ